MSYSLSLRVVVGCLLAATLFASLPHAAGANISPVASPDDFATTDNPGPNIIQPLANDSDLDFDPLTIVSVGQPEHGTVWIRTRSNPDSTYLVFSPERGFAGDVTFPYTIEDGNGGQATSTVTVHVTLASPFSFIVAESTGAVPGEEEGAKFVRFGPPGLDGDQPFYRGFFKRAGASRLLEGVFGTVDGSPFKVVTGDEAPGVEGGTFVSFADPVAANGFAFLGRIKGKGINSSNDDGLWSTTLPEAPGTLMLVAREGDEAPLLEPGNRYQSIISYGMSFDGNLQWLARLKHAYPLASAADDLVLYVQTPLGPELVIRTGSLIRVGGVNRRVKSFLFLNAPPQSNGDGRTGYTQNLLLNLDGNIQALASYVPGNGLVIATCTGQSPIDASDIRLGPFYIPSGGGFGSDMTFRAKIRTGFSPNPSGEGIFGGLPENITRYFVTGDPYFGGAAQFSRFGEPVTGVSVLAFRAIMTGRGFNASNNEFLFWTSSPEAPLLIAAERGFDYGQGAKISSFAGVGIPLVFSPEGRGPVYTTILKGAGVTNRNNFALSAVGPSAESYLLARTGGTYLETSRGPKLVARIGAFTAVPKSPTQRRTVGTDTHVIYLATFTDGTQAVVRVEVP